ncbi:MAG: hypothetical protein AAF610_00650 [Pseudomonadota bacterium]
MTNIPSQVTSATPDPREDDELQPLQPGPPDERERPGPPDERDRPGPPDERERPGPPDERVG